ncbi:MAG: RHS repeat protein [Armatimonadetes bacterium]|nr:MAG: RHS repeat protein [Armatimonadota bacterium]
MSSTASTRSFDASAPSPWDRSPPAGGTQRQFAQSHGSTVDPVLHNPHFPHPDPVSGALLVDPDILLKARGFDLEINLFYNSRSSANGAYGKKRSLSTNCYVLKNEESGNLAQVVRGDEKVYEFTAGSPSGFTTTYSGVPSQYAGTSLVYNSDIDAFIETFPDGKMMVYDKNQGGSPVRYQIGRVEDASGNRHTFTYGTSPETNLLKNIEVPGGRLVTFTYTAGGSPTSLLDHIEDWGGRRWTMMYDGSRQLTTLTTPLGCTTKMAYTGDLLTRIEDPRGFATTYAYDGANRVASVSAGSGVWTYAYGGPMAWSGSQREDPSGAITTYIAGGHGIDRIIHPEGYTTSFVYDTNGYQTKRIEPYGTVTSISYNGSGQPLVAFDALGYATTYAYDASLNLTTMTDALGNVWSFTYDASKRMTARIDPLGRRTTYAWNGDGSLLSTQDGRGLFTTHAYDGFGNLASTLYSDGSVVTYGYDELGRRTSVQQPGDSVARSMVYDAGDNLVASVDLNGARTTYVWDSCLLVAVANPLNERTSYTYSRFKSRITEQNPLGFVTTYNFDNMNRPSGMMDALGNLTTVHYSLNRKVADENALGFRTSYTYDFSNRLTGVQDPRGNVWTSVYDNRDLVARMDPQGNLATSVFDKVGRQTASVSPLGFRTTQVFDAAGQHSASQDQLGYLTSYSYDPAGNRTVVQDANGKLTTTSYFSNRNLPEATIDAMGYRTTYAFDAQSRLVSTRDANGGYVTNVYDVVGRLALVQNQLGENARQFGYDLAGRIVTMADAANRVRSYTFDAAGQNTVTVFPDGKIATFAFDKVGRRTTMVDWGGTSTYSFDALGRQSGQTDAAGFVQAYGYDPNGNRTGLNLVGTGLFTFTFDSLNRLATAQKPGNALYTLSYDGDSRRTTMMLGNGTTRGYQFDNRGQLTTQIEFSGATPLCTIVDGYDPVGNRLTRNLDGNPITWSYDDLYRLTGQMKPGQVATYTLDGVGNLRTMWEGGNFPRTFTFNAADRLVTMVEGANLTTYAWTGYGALESEVTGNSTKGYAYNGQDQLAVVTDPSGDKTTYSFDGDGLRRSVATTNVNQDPPTLDVTTMVWDGSDYLLLNEPTQNRVVLTLDGEIVSCGSKDLLTDPLGTLVKEISAGASLGGLVQLTPYGTLLPTSEEPSIPFIYVAAYGYYNDSAERDYVRARELYKKLGRWMQVDELWPDSRAFIYASSSPSRYIDPLGLQPQMPELCRQCAFGILRSWFPLDAHKCSSCYAHCMACCVLAGIAGESCALGIQKEQNFWNGDDRTDRFRMQYCKKGLKVWEGISKKKPFNAKQIQHGCHSGCRQLCPVRFKDNPREECRSKFRIDPKTGEMEATYKTYFPYLDRCDPVCMEKFRTWPGYG